MPSQIRIFYDIEMSLWRKISKVPNPNSNIESSQNESFRNDCSKVLAAHRIIRKSIQIISIKLKQRIRLSRYHKINKASLKNILHFLCNNFVRASYYSCKTFIRYFSDIENLLVYKRPRQIEFKLHCMAHFIFTYT